MTRELPPRSDRELEERLSRPAPGLAARLADVPGDILVLGAGGKMGPSLARMAKRADPSRRVIAASRWVNAMEVARGLRDDGVETPRVDLLDPLALARLPDVPNLVFMAGQKFGTATSPEATWATNVQMPESVAARYAGVRTVVFSTGNVYPLTPPERGGSREADAPGPVGDYAVSCLERERRFAARARESGTPVSIVRLNYAHDLRYGVLTDLARKLVAREPVSVRMGWVNVIWQGDANARALAALARAAAPEPFVVNVAGHDTLRVADLARALATRLGVTARLEDEEAPDALLSNAGRMTELLGDPLLPVETLLDWVADWVARGGTLLDKPTKFERRDGRF
jgi:nucleoside-diphosphate-sugar epimerase